MSARIACSPARTCSDVEDVFTDFRVQSSIAMTEKGELVPREEPLFSQMAGYDLYTE